MSKKTVFIIDDDPSARNGLTRLLSIAGLNTESFANARDFLAIQNFDEPGCILLDVKMPDMTGPELQEELIKLEYNIPIIFLTAHGDVPTTAQAMKYGAVDFLMKPVDRDVLLEAIRVSYEKDTEIRKQKAENKILNEKLKTLTRREYQVMTYVITGMLNKQIAAKMNISEETVKIHRGRVMQKLGIVSIAELVRLCGKVGIAPAQTSSQ
jgi:FixJ family two-component response regulator